MKKFSAFLFVVFLTGGIFLPSSALSQYLIQLSPADLPAADGFPMFWQEIRQEAAFAVVPDVEALNRAGIPFQVLDQDVEAGAFYWLESRFRFPLQTEELNALSYCKLLWSDSHTALARAQSGAFLKNLPGGYTVQRIYFRQSRQRPTPSPAMPVPAQTAGAASFIQDILDSVNIAQIYSTVEHLSGEEPYWINGQWDSMMTRYSNSPQIFKAQNYIQDRLEQMGYTVELFPFAGVLFYDIQFAPGQSSYGWLASDGKIFGTADGGQNWSVQYTNAGGSSIWSVFPLDGQTAWAVGDGGLILKTSNGATWQTQSSPSGNFLLGVYFRTPDLGWICGDFGVILKTTNGGATWSQKSTPTSNRLYDIYFASDTEGWAVGRSGAIIRTTNGGETWTSQQGGTASRLYGVHFLTPTNGFAVGWDGRVLRTTNGGSNWSAMSIPLNEYFYDVDFLDQNNGMIVGWGGACLKTTNGGSNWSAAGNILQGDAYSLDMLDANTVWASGEGVVASSSNSGSAWQSALSNIPESSLNNVYATKTGTLYPDKYYIICGHYDDTSEMPTVRAPGADDNASGTATVIEAARVLANYNFLYSIRFMAFSGEEQGLVGSAAYAAYAAANGEQILGVINLDMVGYDGNNDGIMEIHAGNLGGSQAIGSMVASKINAWGLPLTPQYITSGSTGASDHASFWSHGYPAILMIEDFSDFTPFYHTTNDRISTLRQSYFRANARLAIGSLAVLAQIDSTTVGIPQDGSVPQQFALHAPYPNPFNPAVNLRYDLPSTAKVTVEVYNLLGQQINQLVNTTQPAGEYRVRWNGVAASGAEAPSGVYFLRVQAGEQVKTQKLLLIR
ncbi:MAG: M28 family peptidase [Calditrichaceae bacterium]|nr:M28 family peptidase [Calditrichia bacterium]NUQ41309.1 M28 family peptidase [Calditrichaceae bacterium]